MSWLCLSDWKTCRHVQTLINLECFFSFVCGSLLRVFLSDTFLRAAVPLIHCSLSLQHQGGIYPVTSRLPFSSNRKLYEIVVSYGREPCWQHVTTSERSKLPAPWLKVMLMLQLCFCMFFAVFHKINFIRTAFFPRLSKPLLLYIF